MPENLAYKIPQEARSLAMEMEEYKGLRSEILKRSEVQHQIVNYSLVVTAAFLTLLAAVSARGMLLIALAHPIIVMAFAMAWADHDAFIARAGAYLRRMESSREFSWERSFSTPRKGTQTLFPGDDYGFFWTQLVFTATGFIVASVGYIKNKPSGGYGWIVYWMAVFVICGVTWMTIRRKPYEAIWTGKVDWPQGLTYQKASKLYPLPQRLLHRDLDRTNADLNKFEGVWEGVLGRTGDVQDLGVRVAILGRDSAAAVGSTRALIAYSATASWMEPRQCETSASFEKKDEEFRAALVGNETIVMSPNGAGQMRVCIRPRVRWTRMLIGGVDAGAGDRLYAVLERVSGGAKA